jgi:septum formation protein
MLILASGSASRTRILRGAHVPFTAMPANIDEEGLKIALMASGKSPEAVAAVLAEAKALHVSAAHPDALVLGADQVLEFGGELVSKCADMTAARALLRRLRGKAHRLISALSLVQGGKAIWAYCDTSTLRMRPFSDPFLESYLSTEGEGLLAGVGCYRLEGMGAQLFESVEGDYFSILGLPLQPLLAELRKKGVIAQ